MTNEIILSTIENKGKDIINAPFWKNCYHNDEVTQEMRMNGKQWYEYYVKFDGLKPVQLTKTKKIKKLI
jgi:hypothetical protein